MYEYYPLLIVGAIIGILSIVFSVAFALMKDKKHAIGFDRNKSDSEIIARLLRYAKPYRKSFLLVGVIMLVSIAYDVVSPLVMGQIVGLVKEEFGLSELFVYVGVYVALLVVSLVGTYLEAIILQRTGQKILSAMREEVFTHIESLSHAQLNAIPVGTLVTRVANDTGAISQMFTDVLVNLVKNVFVVVGVLIAMLLLNYELTLMVLCFVPFIILFTVIFRKFSRAAYRKVKDGTTDINTYLSENLSGIKVTQIFNREDEKMADFVTRNRRLGKAKEQEIFVFGVFRPMVYLLYIASVLCLFYLGGRGYIKDTVFLGQTITSEVIVAFYMYVGTFFNPIQSLAEQFNRLQSAFASAEKIFTVLDIVPDVVDEPDAVELNEVKGDIEFQDVWFAYVPGEWVLKGVSF
ncbi:MAG: ABC transporter transmembrane domain-containing protein, partial [Christensenellaceae bacterium]